MDKLFFLALGASLTVLGVTTLRLLTLGRFRSLEWNRKQEFFIRIVGMLSFIAIWLMLARLLGWKPK